MGKGQDLYTKAKKRIPGGTQLLSKRPEMFLPDQWPSYYASVKGVEVTDLDGKKYIDMSINGIGACILGAADPDVDAAVKNAIDHGTMATLNCPEEVELADLLCELHPWAHMVRYARCGGEAMAIAVRIARAATGKDQIAFCGYHGWHDWYLAANLDQDQVLDGHLLPGLAPKGVPRGLIGTMHPFRYNKLEELKKIVTEHGSALAAIVMEPIRSNEPAKGFLEGIRTLADSLHIPLIFDEVSAGFRLNVGGAHLLYGVNPDIAIFAKAMGNGYPMAAIIGTKKIMAAAQDTFISSTYWTERIGPVAALATIRKFRERSVHIHLIDIGRKVQEGWKKAAKEAGIDVHVDGIMPMGHLSFQGASSRVAHTYFTQAMLDHGYLASGGFYATYAHTERHVEEYLTAVRVVFKEIAQALAKGTLSSLLQGPEAHTGFRRLT